MRREEEWSRTEKRGGEERERVNLNDYVKVPRSLVLYDVGGLR